MIVEEQVVAKLKVLMLIVLQVKVVGWFRNLGEDREVMGLIETLL